MNPKELLNELVEWLKSTVEGSIKKLFEDNTDKIVESINNKENINPKDVSDPIVESVDEVKKSVDSLEFPEQIDNRDNIDNVGEKVESLGDKIDKLNPQVNINNDFKELEKVIKESGDKAQLIKGLSAIKDKIESPNDYTELLEEISNKIKETDNSKVEELLSQVAKTADIGVLIDVILEKQSFDLLPYISKGRIKVEVDRVGQGGGGGASGTYNKDFEQVNPATEDKQNDQITNQAEIIDNQDEQTAILEDLEDLVSPSTDLEGGGKVSVGTTAVEMTFTGTTREIILTADQSNNDLIYWGKSNVDSSGNNAIGYLEYNNVIRFPYNDVSNPIYVVAKTGTQNIWKGALL